MCFKAIRNKAKKKKRNVAVLSQFSTQNIMCIKRMTIYTSGKTVGKQKGIDG